LGEPSPQKMTLSKNYIPVPDIEFKLKVQRKQQITFNAKKLKGYFLEFLVSFEILFRRLRWQTWGIVI